MTEVGIKFTLVEVIAEAVPLDADCFEVVLLRLGSEDILRS